MINKKEELLIILIVVSLGLAAAFYLYSVDKYSLLYYGDSTSHLVAARKIFDWAENPGLAQIGTVWLPLPHFLLVPFSLIDPLFFSGFAGTALSLSCLAITSVFLYRIIRSLTGYSHIAFATALLYAANPNTLYMGITAMTEAPFVLFFVGGAYYFQRWYQNLNYNKFHDLIKCSILVSLATFCRYEGWFIPVVLLIIVGMLVRKQENWDTKTKVVTILICLIAFSCISIWVIYNFLNYGDPFEFANAQFYSASSQAADRPYRAALYLQPLNVASIYGITAFAIFGPALLVGAILAIIFHKRPGGNHERKILFIFLAVPPAFTIVSLLVGIGEMAYWFNARFLMLLSPLVIVAVSLFVSRIYEIMK
ncbi:MAG: ArnT family glycosyltransferase, partial [Nitrosopumilaceae archaeon]